MIRALTGVVVASTVLSLAALTPAAAAPDHVAVSSDRGSWTIREAGPHRWTVSWTSPTRLPVRADRPTITGPDGAGVGVSTTASDGRTVRATVTAASRPTPDALTVTLSGDRLDRAPRDLRANRSSAAPPAKFDFTPDRTISPDPGVTGPYTTVSSDYVRPSVKVSGMREPVEMVGHVVEPAPDAQTGPRPLVLFLHGRHEYCYQATQGRANYDWPCHGPMREIPSHLGYVYAQKLLASQGYATVSVRVNGINAQDYDIDDAGASARAAIVIKHLDYWTTIAAQHQVDMNRVVLIGHSRGGEGVDRASLRIRPSAPYRIAGQVLIAPTDFAAQTAPYIPTVTLLPYCDGDVSDLEGQRFTDVARDISGDDTSLKSSVLIMGANHNFFNSEWTPGISKAPSNDDWYGEPNDLCGTRTPERLTASQQRDVGQAYIAGAVELFTRSADAASVLPMFDGSRVTVPSAGHAVALSHAIGGGRDLRRPGNGTTLSLPDGAASTFCDGSASVEYRAGLCGSQLGRATTPHWGYRGSDRFPTHKFWQLSWTKSGQSGGLQLARPMDLRSRTLDLRTIVDYRLGSVGMRVRLTDTSGASATLTPQGGPTVHALPSALLFRYFQVAKLWAQAVRVDAASAAGTIDLAHVARVEIIGASTRGRVWVADLTATPATLAAAGDRRAPTLSIGSLRVAEGDHVGTSVAQVPFRLSRPMDRAGSFRVTIPDERTDSSQQFTIDLSPGQQSGTIPVAYRSDRLDSPARHDVPIVAYATRTVMTDDYLGTLTVLDDDPTPKVTVARVHKTVKEGASALWRITLAKPVGYDLYVTGAVVRGPGRDLTAADVPARWLARHAFKRGSSKSTLAARGTEIFALLRAGSRTVTLSIPIRRDHVRERREAVTLRVHVLGSSIKRTVHVAKSR